MINVGLAPFIQQAGAPPEQGRTRNLQLITVHDHRLFRQTTGSDRKFWPVASTPWLRRTYGRGMSVDEGGHAPTGTLGDEYAVKDPERRAKYNIISRLIYWCE